ncbi:uncharacterized protein LOC115597353 [Xyrichtys novacula]|uniref:Uncharacterized protein LOC115597353 n=1 Tax=Xyrichtys novacula TaxID=13765 RepID=A0AAV1EXL3_XYRNO|nr:uncharacterized protein LOC115597353 [Xyrichtys novacula]
MPAKTFLLILTSLLLVTMSSAYDEDEPQFDCISESPQESDAEDAIGPEEASSLRRSSRLARKKTPDPSIKEWQIPKLLQFLFSNNIPAPIGASHQELFGLFLSCSEPQRPPASTPPPSAPRKAAAKCKHTTSNSGTASAEGTAQTHKRARITAPAASHATPSDNLAASTNADIMSALSSIQSSLSSMNTRIQTLEANVPTPFQATTQTFQDHVRTTSSIAGPSSQLDDVIPVPYDNITVPRRTLGSAVPITTGVPFYPPAAAISPNLRSQILAGNDINLVKILLFSDVSDKRVVDCGDISVLLKDSDPRLFKSLTLAEFTVAFGIYRDVICEVYPFRRAELDTYLAIIADLAMTYGGTLFYEYHKSFSAKAAMFIQRFNQRVDWSVVDLALISRHCTGRQALSCSICSSFSHSSNLCPKSVATVKQPRDLGYETKVKPSITPVCINFNENVCKYANCRYFHACSFCGDGHPKSVCPRRSRLVRKK